MAAAFIAGSTPARRARAQKGEARGQGGLLLSEAVDVTVLTVSKRMPLVTNVVRSARRLP
jgi:hypothetical protein